MLVCRFLRSGSDAFAAAAVALRLIVRYVVLALIYGRRVIITSAVGAKLVAATTLVAAMVSRHPAIIVGCAGDGGLVDPVSDDGTGEYIEGGLVVFDDSMFVLSMSSEAT